MRMQFQHPEPLLINKENNNDDHLLGSNHTTEVKIWEYYDWVKPWNANVRWNQWKMTSKSLIKIFKSKFGLKEKKLMKEEAKKNAKYGKENGQPMRKR